MEKEITKQQYYKYLKSLELKNKKINIHNKFNIGNKCKIINNKFSKDDIFIIDFYYLNKESFINHKKNKISYSNNIYYIVHNSVTNEKYTIHEKYLENIDAPKKPEVINNHLSIADIIKNKYGK